MIKFLEPPSQKPPVAIAGNYEEDNPDEITCPHCGRASGWNRDLWEYNPPENGFYCNNCGQNFFLEGEL